ncbi:hypothetical protein KAU11_04870 [Candidatus Babeliales bacterium]|nr:hypothetical protein [Candidatus Babeliales bacterium]
MKSYIFSEETDYYSGYSTDYGDVYDANILFSDEEALSWDDEDSDDSSIPPTQIILENLMLECPAPEEEAEC